MTEQKNLAEISLIELMSNVIKVSEDIVIKKYSGNLRLRSKKYTQLRLMGIAHALFKDMISIAEHGSARTLELLVRPLIEIYINFRWIGLSRGNLNYSLYVIDDHLKRAKHVDHIITYIQKTSKNKKDIKDWEYVKRLNLSQAKEAVRSSKFVAINEKYPSISDKAREIDRLYPATQNSFEWLILYPYSFAHMAVHVTNSQLNRMTDDVTDKIQIMGSKEELEHAAFDALTIFLGLLEDYARIFRIKTDLKEYWDQALAAKN